MWGHVSIDMSYPCHMSLPSWLLVVGHGGPLRERAAASVGMEDRAWCRHVLSSLYIVTIMAINCGA
jgi:hypothetical protein